MENLLAMYDQHVKNGVPPDVLAAWLHHRFTQIHPFQDGNGRIARALASLVFIRSGWFPLVILRELRNEYITRLEEADKGQLEPLVKMFARIQKKAFIKALSLSENVLGSSKPVSTLITSGIEKLKNRFEVKAQNLAKVFDTAEEIEKKALARTNQIAAVLNRELGNINSSYSADAFRSNEQNRHFYHNQIIRLAKQHDYFADTLSYRSWIRLKIVEENQSDLIFSFHSIGHEFIGILVCTAFIEFREQQPESSSAPDGPYPLHSDIFQFSYNEASAEVLDRYEQWLEEAIITGIDYWRNRL